MLSSGAGTPPAEYAIPLPGIAGAIVVMIARFVGINVSSEFWKSRRLASSSTSVASLSAKSILHLWMSLPRPQPL